MLGPGARLVTSAAERIVQTPAASSPTLTVLATIAGTVAAVATTVVSLRGFIKDELAANSKEQTANINMLKSELAANSKEQTANISMLKSELAANSKEQTATISMLKSELVANTASGRELKSEVNTKLDAVSTSVQAQRVQSADLRGQVGVLRDVVTTTPSPTQK